MKILQRMWIVVSMFVLAACGLTTPLPPTTSIKPPLIPVDDALPFVTVDVFFATDRNMNDTQNPNGIFGSSRSTLRYGICEVSIPRDHKMGEVERPEIWRFQFREDPEKHVVLQTVKLKSIDDFYTQMSLLTQDSGSSDAFIFIHGYNVSFAEAARRTGQMTYDLGFKGAPIFYSWPSNGYTRSYIEDETNIAWAEGNFKAFMTDFFSRSEANNVYLIAHSMGSRALSGALKSLLMEKPEVRDRIKEIILAAPDIDADVFKRDIAPELHAQNQQVTLYSSSQDKALAASRYLHGYSRLGEAGNHLSIIPGIETIDATRVKSDFLGHSYYGASDSVLSDIFYLINHRKRPDDRFGLRSVETQAGKYWEFKPR